jgi:DNA polymerase-3 subunit gamma/tau
MGLVEQEVFFDFIEAIKNKDAQFCIDAIAKLISRGKNIAKFLEGLLWHIRNIMLAKIMKTDLEELLDLPKEVIQRVIEQSKNLSLQETINIFTAIINTQDMAKKIDSFRIPLEVMVVRLTHKESEEKITPKDFPKDSHKDSPVTIASKIKLNNAGFILSGPDEKDFNETENSQQIKIADNSNHQNSESTQDNNQDIINDSSKLEFKTILDNWSSLIDAISQEKMSVGTYLKEANPANFENGILTISFPKRAVFYKEAVEQRQNQKIITEKIKSLFNTTVNLKFKLSEDSPDDKEAENPDNPFLKSVLDTFKGKVFKKEH